MMRPSSLSNSSEDDYVVPNAKIPENAVPSGNIPEYLELYDINSPKSLSNTSEDDYVVPNGKIPENVVPRCNIPEYVELYATTPRYPDLKNRKENLNIDDKLKTTAKSQKESHFKIKPWILCICVILAIILSSAITFAVTYITFDKQFKGQNENILGKDFCPKLKKTELGIINNKTTLPFPMVVSVCPKDWVSYYNWCYRIYDSYKTWQQARDFCRSTGTDLLSLHSSQESTFLTQNISKNEIYWIGLNKIGTEGVFVWSDGSINNYTNWIPVEPNNLHNNEDCVNLHGDTGLWNDRNCFMFLKFICKIDRTSQCGYGSWFLYNGACYMIRGMTSSDWSESKQICESNGAELLNLQTKEEFNFLKTIMKGSSADMVWIGRNNIDKQTHKTGMCTCISTNPVSGWWDVNNCQQKHGYICKKQLCHKLSDIYDNHRLFMQIRQFGNLNNKN